MLLLKFEEMQAPLQHATFTLAIFFCSTMLAQDLSQLTEEEKEEGIGQFQPKIPKNKEPNTPRSKPKDDRPRHHRSFVPGPAPIVIGGLGAGAIGAGSLVLSQHQPWQESSSGPAIVDEWGHASQNDGLTEDMDPSLFSEQTELHQPNLMHTEPLKLRFKDRYRISAKAEALFLRDMSGLNVPITQGIQSSRLRWNNGIGVDANFSISPRTKSDFGFDLGFLSSRASDSVQTSSATLLFTDPHIGFAAHPFSSRRETGFLSFDSNFLLPDGVYHAAIGFRITNVEDLLENRVLSDGLTHRIDTNSTTYLLQASISPRWEFQFVHIESLFQIGAGAFYGEATTQLRNVVGGPSPGGDDIFVDRWKGTVYFRGKLGAAIPIGYFGKLRAGFQFLAQDQYAHPAGQMRSVDFITPSYGLQTNSYLMGGLFVGLELYR